MDAPFVHVGGALFFVAALVMLARYRYFLADRAPVGFRDVVFGVSLLSVTSMLFLADAVNLIGLDSIFNQPVILNLFITIVVISGVILVASGMSELLPAARMLMETDNTRLRRLQTIREIEQLVNVESRTPELLRCALRHVVDGFDFTSGRVFVVRRGTNLMREVGEESVGEETTESSLRVFADSHANSDDNMIRVEIAGSSDTGRPDTLVPVPVHSRTVAAMLLWSERRKASPESEQLLKLIGDILGRAIESRLTADRDRSREEAERIAERLSTATSESDSLESVVPAITRVLRDGIPFDLALFSMVLPDGTGIRFSIGANDKLLVERNLDPSAITDEVQTLPDSHVSQVSDIPLAFADHTGAILKTAGITTALHLPLGSGESFAQCILGSADNAAFLATHRRIATSIRPVLATRVGAALNEYRRFCEQERMRLLGELLHDHSGYRHDIGDFLQRAAKLVRESTRVAAVRISTFEDDGTFLQSRALSTVHPIKDGVPVDGYLVLSLMPLHSRVRRTGDPVEISAHGNSFSIAEAQQVYQSNVKAAYLQPVHVGRDVAAIIALVDRRRSERVHLDDADLSFVRTVAGAVSIALRLHESPWGALDHADRSIDRERENNSSLRRQIRSSLSGILGSVENLRSREHTPADVNQLVGIIDRSARRLEECVLSAAESTESAPLTEED